MLLVYIIIYLKSVLNQKFLILVTCNSATTPVAASSKVWFYGRSLAGNEGPNPAGGMNVCCNCCVLSGRGLCTGLIAHPEESYAGANLGLGRLGSCLGR